jgi:putative flippase GtrA
LKIEWQAWWLLPQQARFLIAGGLNTIIGYLVFSTLYLLLQEHVHYLEIGVFSQAIALTSAFVVYRRLVFRSKDHWLPTFVRFNMSQLVAFGFGLAGLYVLVRFGHVPPLLAQAVVLLLSVVLSYALHRYYSFRRGSMKVAG